MGAKGAPLENGSSNISVLPENITVVCTMLNTNGTKENDSVLSESCTAFLLPLSVGLHLFPVYFCMAFVKVCIGYTFF